VSVTVPTDPAEANREDPPPHDDALAVGVRQRLAVFLFIGADAVFVACLLFTYFYLRGLDTDGQWLPKGVHAEAAWSVWVITAVAVASALVLRWGEHGIDEDDKGRLVLGVAGALVLVVADIVMQVWQLSTLSFNAGDGAYASSFRVLVGYHLVHLLLLAFLGFGLLARARMGLYRAGQAGHVRLVRYVWDWVAVAAVLTAIATLFVASPRAG